METGAGFYYRQTITALVASAQIPPLKSRRELEAGFPVRELDDQVFVVKSHDLTGTETLVNHCIADLKMLPGVRFRIGRLPVRAGNDGRHVGAGL